MKILHVIPAYFPATLWGGPIHVVHGLNRALAQLPGMRIKVLTTDSAGPGIPARLEVRERPFTFAPGHEVFYCRRNAGDSVSAELLQRLPALVRWAELVHLTYTYSFPTIPTILACRLARKPLVWSPRGALQFTQEWKSVRRSTLKKAWEVLCNAMLPGCRSALHVTTEREKAASQGRMRRAKAIMVPNGVDIPRAFSTKAARPRGRLRLMYLGRIDPIKGLDNLLQSLRLFPDPGVTLDVFGQGDLEYTRWLRSLARELGLDTRVTFRGHVEADAKTAAFGAADVCVVPSHHENFCNVVAESLAHAVPVIASKGTPWPSIAERGCGLWVDNDPESLSRAIRQISTQDLAQMGERGRAWMASEYSWDRVAVMMRDLYRATIAGGAVAGSADATVTADE